jgi:hypothetical protein
VLTSSSLEIVGLPVGKLVPKSTRVATDVLAGVRVMTDVLVGVGVTTDIIVGNVVSSNTLVGNGESPSVRLPLVGETPFKVILALVRIYMFSVLLPEGGTPYFRVVLLGTVI